MRPHAQVSWRSCSVSETTTAAPDRVRDRLAGHQILVTGSTGFLAKAFVEKLLRSVDSIGGIHLLVRGRGGEATPEQRVRRNVLGTCAFDRLRAMHGEAFEELCARKIHVVGGDLSKPRLGMTAETYDRLTDMITLVVNSAATVTFDERLDEAVELNTLGPGRLLQFAKDCQNAPMLHVSTCYVCGARTGRISEDFSAPHKGQQVLPRIPGSDAFDLDAIVDSMKQEVAEVIERLGADTEECRRELIDRGMDRARAAGWNDTYTFTKWIGEQLLVRDRGHVPLVIHRPAIIEGSFDEPTPGWIDGLRMADPIIVAYGQRKLNDFPGAPDIALDLIPVDFVVNSMIATLPVGSRQKDDVALYQCASSDRNPLMLRDMRVSLVRAFASRPMHDDTGKPIDPGPLRLVDREAFVGRFRRRRQLISWLQRVYATVGITGRRARRLSATLRRIEQVLYFAKIYTPYTHLDCRFSVDNLHRALDEMHPHDRAMFPCDITRVEWDDYVVNRHVPGLRSYVLGTGATPTRRLRAVEKIEEHEERAADHALAGENLFEVFKRSAQRFPSKPAFQIRRLNRWVRYTYEEAYRATGAIAKRISERGLGPGDRLAICAESAPEWALTYLAAQRAGLTAVPLDPQLPPAEAWAAARFAGAKLLCASPNTIDRLEEARSDEDAELVRLREPFVPPPGATRDDAPQPAPIESHELASILFTSGTTVAPKAVKLTHANFIANAKALLDVHPIYSTDEFLSVLPMYHAFEFTGGFVVPIASGATITYVEHLKGPEIVAAMQACGTTIMLVVPRLLRSFYDSIQANVAASGALTRAAFRVASRLSDITGRRYGRRLFGAVHKRFGGRLRMFVAGGSRLEPDVFHGFQRLGFPVYEGYGLTETSPVLTVNPPSGGKPGSVGPPLPNIELELRNTNLEGIGEVWVKGPSVMSGYLNNPDATADILVDDWLRTGDLGRVDNHGFLHLTGRSKDLIITGAGKNVYPDEVELHYADLPYVRDLCVFGMPSPDGLGDAVHAVVVMDADASPELDRSSLEREIRLAVAGVSESLPSHQRLAALHFWDRDLPKTSTLKAKRGLIREMVQTDGAGIGTEQPVPCAPARKPAADDEAAEQTPAFAMIRRVLANHCPHSEEEIRAHMHLLLDLGIDSVGKIEVLGAVEATYGMHIADDKAAKVARVADLVNIVGDRTASEVGKRKASAWQRRLKPSAGAGANGRLDDNLSPALLPVRWMIRGVSTALMKSYVRVSAEGLENVPKTGAFVLAPNHSSHLDSPSVVTALGGARRIWAAGAEDYFFSTPTKRFLFGKVYDTIAFDRHADGIQGLRRCGAALKRGDGLLIFPEGTRSTDGTMQKFKIGAAVLAMEAGVPIVPVHIHNTFNLYRKGQRFPKPGKVIVTFGTPIMPPPAEETEDHFAAFRTLTDSVEASVAAMAAEAKTR